MSIEALLRDGLAEKAQTVRVPTDPWADFAHREKSHRRRRRARRGALGLALAAMAGVQTNLLPMPGWAPAVAIAAVNAELVDSPIRGSLANDTEWLEGMRGRAEDSSEDEGVWKADRARMKFLFASDVNGLRVALAYVPMRLGVLSSPQLTWFTGEAGAEPADMWQSGNTSADETAVGLITSIDDGTLVAVTVGAEGTTAAISTGIEYTAAGTVEKDTPVSGRAGAGYASAVVPSVLDYPQVTMTVTENGTTSPVSWSGGYSTDESEESVRAAQEREDRITTRTLGTLGDSDLDHSLLKSWLLAAAAEAGLDLADVRTDLRWTGTVNQQPAALFTLQEPGQGVLVFAFHGTYGSYSEDLRALMPSAGAKDRPIAWRMRAQGDGDTATSTVNVVAPPATASLELTVGGQPPQAVELDDSGRAEVTVALDAEATVTAYTEDGTELGTSPVLPLDREMGIIGLSEGTRMGS